MVEKLNRSTLVVVNQRNELVAVQIISKDQLGGCNASLSIMMCNNLTFTAANYRTANLLKNIAYIDALPKQLEGENNVSSLDKTKTNFYSLFGISLWGKYAPEELTSREPHCKKCLYSSRLCDQAIDSIPGIERCEGK